MCGTTQLDATTNAGLTGQVSHERRHPAIFEHEALHAQTPHLPRAEHPPAKHQRHARDPDAEDQLHHTQLRALPGDGHGGAIDHVAGSHNA